MKKNNVMILEIHNSIKIPFVSSYDFVVQRP